MDSEPWERTHWRDRLSSSAGSGNATYDCDEGSDNPRDGEANSSNPLSTKPAAPNPEGKNQFPDCPRKTSPWLQGLLRRYHRITTNRRAVRDHLVKYHGITISERTIARHWKEMGLKASGATEASLSPEEIVKIVHHRAREKPPLTSPSKVKRRIARETGVHLKRDTIARILREKSPPLQAEPESTPAAQEERESPRLELEDLEDELFNEMIWNDMLVLRNVLLKNMTKDIRHDLEMFGREYLLGIQ